MTITTALNYINTSIKTAFANAIKVLGNNVYKVKFPDVQKVEGIVKTDTSQGFNNIVKKIEETKQLFGQKGIQVNNFPKFPERIEVTNFPKEKEIDLSNLEKKISELNESIKKLPTEFPEFPEFPEIKIPPQKEIKFPEFPKFPEIPVPEKVIFPKSFSVDNLELLKSEDPSKYIPVRLTDGEEFYKAIEEFYQQVSSAVTFTDSQNKKTSALVDSDRHVQVDVLTAPPVTVDTSDLATADNQTNGSQKTQILDLYNVNNIKTVGLVTYIGMEDKNGVYCIKKIDSTTDDVFTYATITNNPTITTYANAWAGILTNTYSIYSLAF